MQAGEPCRVAELVATVSIATEYRCGTRLEQGLYAAIVSARFAEALGMPEEEALAAYYLSLLRLLGSALPSDHGLEDIVRDLFGATRPSVEHSGAGVGRASALAERVVRGFRQMCQRPELGVAPSERAHEAIDRAVHVARLAHDAQAVLNLGDIHAAMAMVRARLGSTYPADLAEAFLRHAPTVLCGLEPRTTWDTALKAEPGRRCHASDADVDAAVAAMGAYADMTSSYFQGHSSGVASIAGEAAQRLGLSAAEVLDVQRAGQLHDLGRVSVPTAIWDKKAPLTHAEHEHIRMHAYVTERILSRLSCLGRAAAIASMAHERLDHSGYHRRLPATFLPISVRVLAAADAYNALLEARPHRRAFSPERAADELRREVREQRLDAQAAEGVLAAAGHRSRSGTRRSALSCREVQVLRLVARGLTNKEIAVALNVSAKTVGHHLQHAFAKIGVSTRSAAGLFAVQNGLVAAHGDA